MRAANPDTDFVLPDNGCHGTLNDPAPMQNTRRLVRGRAMHGLGGKARLCTRAQTLTSEGSS